MENEQQSFEDPEERQPSPERLSDSIWKPWYAKLWWVAIPIYWLPASGPTGIELIDAFYGSKLFPYTSPFFLPVTAFLILAFGFLQRRFADAPFGDGVGSSYRHPYEPPVRPWERPGYMAPTSDPTNPRSGFPWLQRRMRRLRA